MELVRNFKKLDRTNADLAGGKGASLGEMTKAGIPVPPGFVVLSASFEQFIKETDLVQEIDAILGKVNHKEIHTVEAASEAIRALILNAEMPKDIADEIDRSFKELNTKYVAVRSSATAEDGMDHAWAGQLESYLNTKEDDVLTKVKLCWSSLFTPRAIFYRFEKGLHSTKISVAVVVQKMVESEVSGIAFSVHPVTEDWNQLIIEAGFGLGEAIVSGSITPDSYVVEKEPRRIVDINVSTQERALYRAEKASVEHGNNEWRNIPEPKASSQVLNEAQILELSSIILNIEKHYGFPCDIEWAFEKGKFYIVQSRPITTLAQKVAGQVAPKAHEFISPELKGFNPEDHQFTGFWKSGLFATSFWQDSFSPEILSELGLHSKGLGVFNLAGGNFLLTKSSQKEMHVQIEKKIESMDKSFFAHAVEFSNKVFTEGVKVAERLRDEKPTAENFNAFVKAGKRINFIWLLGATYLIDVAEKELQDIVVKESFPAEHVMEAIPKVITPIYYYNKGVAELGREFKGKSLAEIKKDKDLFKKLQAHAEAYPWVEVLNFFGESLTPERLYEQVKHVKDVPEAPHYVSAKPLSKEFVFRAKCMQDCGYIKQAAAEYFSIFSERMLPFLNAVAKKLDITYLDLMTLWPREVESALRGDLSLAEIKKKAKTRLGVDNWVIFSTIDGGVVFCEEPADIQYMKDTMVPKADKNAKEIRGQVGNPGKYVGPARIIMNTHDFHKMQAGDVLVSTMTTPDFVILMQKSGAIVTDIGGMLCHAAIVSREIGTPCVIGTKFATHILKDGDIVEVDADKGVVRILK